MIMMTKLFRKRFISMESFKAKELHRVEMQWKSNADKSNAQ